MKLTAFVRKPVLYRHEAVRCPRLPPLVLVVVTATEKAWMLEEWDSPHPPFFCVTFSPMMPYSRQSVNQWRSLSFQVKRKNGVSLQLSTFTKPKSLPLYFIDLYQTNCSCKASKNTNLYVYSSMTDILCCSSLAGFSCAAI